MSTSIGVLLEQMKELEARLEVELAARQAELRYRIEKGRVVFEEDIARRHRELKAKLLPYILAARPLVLITAPFIYAVIIPLVLLDLFASAYQAICFPVYGIPKVERRAYIVLDRHRLAYLNAVEKLNCAYCAYANGLLAYVCEIASRTEQYWCPIKHAQRIAGMHRRYHDFLEYGDADAYKKRLEPLREQLIEEAQKTST